MAGSLIEPDTPVHIESSGSTEPRRRGLVRAVARVTLTAAAVALLWFASVGPDRLVDVRPAVLARLPVEALVVLGLALVLPDRLRTGVLSAIGVALGVVAVLRVLDLGFDATQRRAVEPTDDWRLVPPALDFLGDAVGRSWAVVLAVLAAAALLTVLVTMPLALLRVSRLVRRRRLAAGRVAVALGAVWALTAAFGVPVAASGAAGVAWQHARSSVSALADRYRFATTLAATDPLAATPAESLLRRLRGKDVVIAFVESYGRVAVQGDSAGAAQTGALLDAGSAQLQQSGLSSRSAFLTSPTFGGGSWLAHSTLQSGLWVDSQQRYSQLVQSDRFTLSDAFRRGGWRTVVADPANEVDWPEGRSFYHYDAIYDARNLGYAGPRFAYATMPDQYLLAAFQQRELRPGPRAPVLAELDLVSSHAPWVPLPTMVDWGSLGDGSAFAGMERAGPTRTQVWSDAAGVQSAYERSIRYTLSSLISWVQRVPDDDLVLVVVGDHQPLSVVSGDQASHDVPITVIARDPTMLASFVRRGWTSGLRPAPSAPTIGMQRFRDAFLTAYSS